MAAAQDEMDRRREDLLKENRTILNKLITTQDEKGALERRFSFESREIHPFERRCAWGDDHPLGPRFRGIGREGVSGPILVCEECWEEIRGHEAIAGS